MSENVPPNGATNTTEDAPDAIVERSRGFSLIWLIPAVVALLAAILAYDAIQNRGVKAVVLFSSAEGLVAGKSKVKYRDVEIGSVDLIRFRDLNTVEVHCTGWLTDGTMFYSSHDNPGDTPIRNRASGFVPGFNEGLATMKPGGRRLLLIPGNLGYGPRGNRRANIPGDATLLFEVEYIGKAG